MRTLIALLLVVGLTSVATAQDAAISGAVLEDVTAAPAVTPAENKDLNFPRQRVRGAAIILDEDGNLVGQAPDGVSDEVVEILKKELVGAEEAGYDTVTDEYK